MEAILNNFCSLSTFPVVVYCVLSCRRVTELLEDCTPNIYQQVARQIIEVESHARALFRDQKVLWDSVLEGKVAQKTGHSATDEKFTESRPEFKMIWPGNL